MRRSCQIGAFFRYYHSNILILSFCIPFNISYHILFQVVKSFISVAILNATKYLFRILRASNWTHPARNFAFSPIYPKIAPNSAFFGFRGGYTHFSHRRATSPTFRTTTDTLAHKKKIILKIKKPKRSCLGFHKKKLLFSLKYRIFLMQGSQHTQLPLENGLNIP